MPKSQKTPALSVDIAGLRLLVERRGKAFAMMELVQNAWDEPGVTSVTVELMHTGRNRAALKVTDDAPEGFSDLSHAYTLFAPSKKKADPTQRGRFNLGEKLVIALADHVTIATTKGTVVIDVLANQRGQRRERTAYGTTITAVLRMTRDEVEESCAAFRTLIPPAHIVTTLNGDVLATRTPLVTFTATLQSEVSDADGFLRPTRRQTTVEVFTPAAGETPALYEMGIPVVETGDAYHVNVLQKVPLNADRDNVPPAFLRDVRTLTLNKTIALLTPEQATTTWVNEALEDELVTAETVTSVLAKRFGERRVVYDPSDAEANRIALSEGYTVIPSNSFSKAAWVAVRESGAVLPAGRVTPSPKPFSADGIPLKMIPVDQYTKAEARFARAVAVMHADVIGRNIGVFLTRESKWGFNGVYGQGRVILNLASLAPDITNEQTLGTVIHEFAHAYGSHLTHAFDEGIALVSARIIRRILANADYLKNAGMER